MISLVRGTVGHVPGGQLSGSRNELVKAPRPQRLEIQKVPDMFLNRPAFTVPSGQNVGSDPSYDILEARGPSTKTLYRIGKHLYEGPSFFSMVRIRARATSRGSTPSSGPTSAQAVRIDRFEGCLFRKLMAVPVGRVSGGNGPRPLSPEG